MLSLRLSLMQRIKKADVSNIKCSACRCKYNENLKCHADDVQINRVTASCDTFKQD